MYLAPSSVVARLDFQILVVKALDSENLLFFFYASITLNESRRAPDRKHRIKTAGE